jgi:hypothetical protein
MNELIPNPDDNPAAAICYLLAGFVIGAILVVALVYCSIH